MNQSPSGQRPYAVSAQHPQQPYQLSGQAQQVPPYLWGVALKGSRQSLRLGSARACVGRGPENQLVLAQVLFSDVTVWTPPS